MTFAVSSVRAMRPADLATASSLIQSANDKFEAGLDEVLRQAENAYTFWTGIAADAAWERAQREVRMGRRIAAQVDALVTACNDGAARLGSARDSLLSAVADAEGAQPPFSVDDFNWTVSDPSGSDREDTRNAHEETIAARLQTFVAEDEAVGFAIDSAVDETDATAADASADRDYQPPPSLAVLPADQVSDILADPAFREWVKNHPDAAKPLLDAAYDAGKIPEESKFYSSFLQNYWQREALEQAGIDPADWDPSRGTEFNKDTITKVYEYYGQLFLNHPDLEWAGMANMIGPSFAGGFYDLNALKQLAGKLGPLSPLGSKLSQAEIKWYESKFLSMQQQIFNDQASMHEAYLHGGTAEIDRMARAGLLDDNGRNAWHAIDAGIQTHNHDLIAQGNKALLYREQHDIIQDDYQDMYQHNGPVGAAVTYGLTVAGEPSIPEARAFGEVFPTEITVRDLLHQATVTSGFPDGNIANFDDRWALIERDTLPAYTRLLDHDFSGAREIVASDFNIRLQENRLDAGRITEIIDRTTDVDVDLDFKWPWEK